MLNIKNTIINWVLLIHFVIPFGYLSQSILFYSVGFPVFIFLVLTNSIRWESALTICILLVLFFFISNGSSLIPIIYISFTYLFYSSKLFEDSYYPRITIILPFVFLSLFIQVIVGLISGERASLSIGDPNFSGLLILLFFFLSNKINFRIGVWLSLLSILAFLSRNLFLAIVVFYFFRLINLRFFKKERIRPIVLLLAFFLLNLFIIVGGSAVLFLNRIDPYEKGSGRLFQIYDRSNYDRFSANALLVEQVRESPKIVFTGMGKFYEKFFKDNVGNKIHNSFLDLIARYGIFISLLYFYIIASLISRVNFKRNLPYIISYSVFSLFLMDVFSGLFLMGFIGVLMIDSK